MYFKRIVLEPVTWLVVAVSLMVLAVFVIEAEALTNVEENKLKVELKSWKTKLVNIDIDIEQQKEKIAVNEIILTEKQELLRQVKKDANDSWTAVKNIDTAVQNAATAELNLKASKEQFISLLDSKNRFNLKIANIEDKLHNVEPVPKFNSTDIAPPTNTTLVPKFNDTSIIPLVNNTDIVIYNPALSLKLSDRNVGVTLSKTCITLIKNNITSTCPTYKELMILDSSNINVSGEFEFSNGYYHRISSPLLNNWRWYDYDSQFRIFIDPPLGMNNRIKMIYLQPNFDTYLGNESSNLYLENGKMYRTIYHDRYVDDCNIATINADKWQLLIADTILYLRNNCNDNFTTFNNKEVIITNATDIDITTSQKYKDDQRLAYIKEFCIFKFRAC